MSESYFLIGDGQAIGTACGTTSRTSRKFRRQGIGITAAAARNEILVAKRDLKQYASNPRIAARMAAKIAALTALLEPEPDENDIRKQLSAAHPDHGGDPAEFRRIKRQLDDKRKKR